MIKGNELYITCRCYFHALHIERDDRVNEWYVSRWIRGYATETSWKYRIKCIWYILVHGRPYGDEIILNKQDMKELKNYIEHQLK